MPIKITDYIAPTDPSDTYATHDAQYGKGGFRAVADVTARDAISADRRSAGMLVYTIADDTTWLLMNDLASWVVYSSAGGSAPAVVLVSVQNTEAVTIYRGTPVSTVTGVQVVKVSASTLTPVHGLVYDASIPAGGSGLVITTEVLSATTDEWDTITGGVGGLVTGAMYYAGLAGMLTATPSLEANYLTRIGAAISPTQLRLILDPPVQL